MYHLDGLRNNEFALLRYLALSFPHSVCVLDICPIQFCPVLVCPILSFVVPNNSSDCLVPYFTMQLSLDVTCLVLLCVVFCSVLSRPYSVLCSFVTL